MLMLLYLLPKGFTRCRAHAMREKVMILKLRASRFCHTGKPCCFKVLAQISIVAKNTELSAYSPSPNMALSEWYMPACLALGPVVSSPTAASSSVASAKACSRSGCWRSYTVSVVTRVSVPSRPYRLTTRLHTCASRGSLSSIQKQLNAARPIRRHRTRKFSARSR